MTSISPGMAQLCLDKEFMMTRRTQALAIGLVLGVSALTACSSDKKATTAGTVPAGSTPVVSTPAAGTTATGGTTAATGPVLAISQFAFGAVAPKAGEKISVINADTANHTVTADDGSFSVDVPAGGTADLTIAKAGTYKIHCKIHSKMTSTIVVS
jgi:plastocyanin